MAKKRGPKPKPKGEHYRLWCMKLPPALMRAFFKKAPARKRSEIVRGLIEQWVEEQK